MPYGKFDEDGKIAVYKVGADKKKVGKRLGLHPDAKAADAQLAALYANEKKAKEADVTKDGEWEPEPIPVEIVEEQCGALSFAELMANYEAQELANVVENLAEQFHEIAENIMKSDLPDKPAALSSLAAEFQQMMTTYTKHEQTEETPGEEIEDHLSAEDKELKAVKQIIGDNQPKAAMPAESAKELFIWKEGNQYRWLAAYSNNRLDDESEIISAASHKEFDEALTKKEWAMPELYLWHIPYPVGVTDYHAFDESAGFPVAAGHFYPGMEWAAEGVVKEKWDATSHGMPEQWIQYDATNPSIITRHRTREISFLPQWAAANKLAFNIIHKELNMSELEKGLPAHKRPEFVKAFGEEQVAQIEEALAAKSKEADDAGIAKKETPVVTYPAMVEVVKEIKEILTGLDNRLAALEKSVVKEDDQFDLVALLKSKSVIGKETAKIDGRSALAKDAPAETEAVSTGLHPVGLVNNLIAANQNWKGGF